MACSEKWQQRDFMAFLEKWRKKIPWHLQKVPAKRFHGIFKSA
jgi:hypothetical protein